MPELPEVETVRTGLAPQMEGRQIAFVEVRRPDLRWPLPERMAERMAGKEVTRLWRRSKYILADLSSGETLLVHLGMSGRILISGELAGQFHHVIEPAGKHDHVVIGMQDGTRITFNDPRRFGAMDLMSTDAVQDHWLLRGLGPEPLGNDFHTVHLTQHLQGRRTPIKSALLDQRMVAGLGNIYVCEVLHRTAIRPDRLARDLTSSEIDRLVPAIRETLREAIEAGGSTLRDYRQADGELGYFQHSFRVYGHEGTACRRPGCAGVVSRIVQSGRSSFFCPVCQR